MTPMAPRKQREIFETTLRLLAERGYDGLTVEGVAEHSGVTGSLRGDLVALVEGVRRLLTEPPACDVAVAALGAAVRHPELDARRFFADRFAEEAVAAVLDGVG
jgi:Tetracyclin repressor-like, C-terminal domain/Bacterial regulatory proteins, tetR family